MRLSKKSVFILVVVLIAAVVYGSQWFERPGVLSGANDQAGKPGEYENALFDSWANALAEADALNDEERDAAVKILRETDPVWSRVKRQNEQAIKRANSPPRIVPPTRSLEEPSRADEVLGADPN